MEGDHFAPERGRFEIHIYVCIESSFREKEVKEVRKGTAIQRGEYRLRMP